MGLLDALSTAVAAQTAEVDRVVAAIGAGNPALVAQAQALTDAVNANTAKVTALSPAPAPAA